ncbi:fumarylacetoacetate hydrolase family protein [Haloarchaeobius sp. HME9146]|uniref:fumarylacetoacetate hydrolase family protein n=1 Tax=Haloarchaeobius sp. HME9146 TaxID=2978732 RepID=UPI0021C1D261|nr:fumarylacetoacetate hydrolase family protein [Haloarchaeobius sp. HME9146]MCT9098031.1 fumarylacetoacetate hydrolase family protein [Haloarchaeobius sp. HME9146]
MDICRYTQTDQSVSLGLLDGETVTPLDTDATTLEAALVDHSWSDLQAATTDDELLLDDLTLLAPVARPTNLVGIGLNYAGHAEEGGFPIPDEPLFFAKSPSSIVGPGADIVKHPEVTELHYEGEFGFVIGKETSRVDEADALDHVFGFVVGNDVTARDMQMGDLDGSNPWYRSKSMDTFTPLGPWVTPVGEGVDPMGAAIETRLNDEVVQSSNTDDHIFPIPEALAYISRHVTLYPGDVVLTGTPAGIGEMHPGDTVSVSVEGIGTLSNTVAEP